MHFRLVPNTVSLNDLEVERRNSPNGCVISPNSVAFWADHVNVVEYTRILSAAEMLGTSPPPPEFGAGGLSPRFCHVAKFYAPDYLH